MKAMYLYLANGLIVNLTIAFLYNNHITSQQNQIDTYYKDLINSCVIKKYNGNINKIEVCRIEVMGG